MQLSDRFFYLDENYCTLEKPLGSPIFRHVFELDHLPTSFELTVCGLGVYELYLNGERVSKGIFPLIAITPTISFITIFMSWLPNFVPGKTSSPSN